MNKILNKIGKATLMMTAVFSLGSCNDFLELKPLNEIVLENYWKDKSDVESLVISCYSGMVNYDFMTRLFVWGDVRSDDVVYSKSGQDNNLRMIAEENILETNPFMKWESFYQVINRCNTVIHYAPIVAQKDPNYTDSELKANIAEATWIRSFCYFYLARTFRDIPYVNKPSIDDTDIKGDYHVPPMPFKDLLKQLTEDLEAVKNNAIRYYPPMESGYNKITNPYNTSRVTTCAMYALLADLYLWQDEYQKCIECTQKVLEYKVNTYEELKQERPAYVSDIKLYSGIYPLIMDRPQGSKNTGYAHSSIFGQGNSFESIFEINYYHGNEHNPLSYTNSQKRQFAFFYNVNDNGTFEAYKINAESIAKDANKYFKYTDNRGYCYFESTDNNCFITKFTHRQFLFEPLTATGTNPKIALESLHSGYQNWLIYRLTDIMLMRAEALIELGSEENLKEAFQLISTVYNRSNNLDEGETNTLVESNYASQASMRELVRLERHRELMFEGKRWFDLVRYALRDGYNDDLIIAVLAKQEKNANKIRVQLQSKDALFWPYAESETDLNHYLMQNPAYITNETSQK